MNEQPLNFHEIPPVSSGSPDSASEPRIEPSTCMEAEAFILRVLDDSMQPEFRQGCIIVIDPTGVARDGSYVLARSMVVPDHDLPDTDGFVFRQLKQNSTESWSLVPLNNHYEVEPTPSDMHRVVGVIVQRAGVRRRYHKHYE